MQFDFSDAEVAQCSLEDGALVLRFAAARVQSAPHAEWQWQPLRCVGTGVVAVEAGDGGPWTGRLHAGRVLQGGERWSTLVVPWQSSTPVRLELEFAQGAMVQLQCQTLAVAPMEGGAAVGAYQC